MTKEKQIEEMAKDLGDTWVVDLEGDPHDLSEVLMQCDIESISEQLYEMNYRKASEVAEELINTALSKIQIMISSIKSQEENGNVTEFNGGAKTALEIVFKDLAELRKKYTEN